MRSLFGRILAWLSTHESWVLAAVILLSAAAFSFNLFSFPYFENDEGTYVSQAWWFVKYHQLSPYTYRYDHSPLGWMIIGFWQVISGGPFTFGFSINSGRILMLIFHLVSAFFIFKITKRLVPNVWIASGAVLIFSLSPLGLYFQRRVLLDNLMTTFMLASIYLLLKDGRNLFSVLVSAILFGMALLIKETAIFLLPGMIFLVFVNSLRENRTFALTSWTLTVAMIFSIYILFAVLKTELLPASWPVTLNRNPHVSLVEAISYQVNRGQNHSPLSGFEEFLKTFFDWLRRDPFIILGGLSAMVINFIAYRKKKNFLAISLLSLSFFLFLLSGKLIINFYIIPLLALFSISIPLALYFIFNSQKKLNFAKNLVPWEIVGVVLVTGFFFFRNTDAYQVNETSKQKQAVQWAKTHLPESAKIIVDNFAFLDMRESRNANDKAFANADFFWNFGYDPQVRDTKFAGDWQKVDYIMLTHEMVVQMGGGSQDLLLSAFRHSQPVAEWQPSLGTYLNLEKLISTNGDWVKVYKVGQDRESFADLITIDSRL